MLLKIIIFLNFLPISVYSAKLYLCVKLGPPPTNYCFYFTFTFFVQNFTDAKFFDAKYLKKILKLLLNKS